MKSNTFDLRGPDVKFPLGAPTHAPLIAPGDSAGRFFSNRWPEYERLKADWIAAHPEATPAEYTRAMRKIAQKCGI